MPQDGTGPSSLPTFAAGPYPHTPPVVGTSGPRQLWEQVGGGGGGGAIIADAKEVECGVLLNWIRAALTARSSTATPPPPPPPLRSPRPSSSGG